MSGNVFVLSADSLRLDRTMDPDVMPFLAQHGAEATRFTNAVANGPFTPASFPTMMASRYPSAIDGIGLPPAGTLTTLAEALSAEGYETALWSDNKFIGSEYNYDRGYDAGAGYETSLRDTVREYIDEDGLLFAALEFGYMRVWKALKNTAGNSHYYATADDLHGKARAWLGDRDPATDDVHLWLHYMDTHHPYEPPAADMPYDDLETVSSRTEANNLTRRLVRSDGADGTPAEIEDAVTLYDAECRSLDAELSAFVGWLRTEGWLGAEDLLVITSDHGEILDDYAAWDVFGHENIFTEECTRVPLVFDHGALPDDDVSGQASLIDLVPTILDLIDVPVPDGAMGESLGGVVAGDEAARDRDPVYYDGTMDYGGVRGADGRKVFNCESRGEDSYVGTEFDPAGGRAYAETETDDPPQDLLSDLRQFRREADRAAREASAVDPDSIQVEQHMQDLGYLE